MLVLSRKEGQEIRIGADVIVTVLRAQSGVVRLGISAPRSIPVLRAELLPVPADTEADSAGR